MFLQALPAFLLLGAISGFFAGLLGIGGGVILVPGLLWIFTAFALVAEVSMQLAVGTSLATIFVTALASYWGHRRHGAVDGAALVRMTPGLVLGGLAGAVIAGRLDSGVLIVVFALFLIIVALLLWRDIRPRAVRPLPGVMGLFIAGMVIACISALLGIGGGTLTTPYLLWRRFDLRRAIATSAACGVPIASAGAVGYLLADWHSEVTSAVSGQTGHVYWPAVFAMSVGAIAAAPRGARLTHRLPVGKMRKGFALLLAVVGGHLLLG